MPVCRVLIRIVTGLALGLCAQPGRAASPENLEEIFRAGAAAYSSGNYAEAAKRYAELLEAAPASPSLAAIQFTLGEARLLAGDAPGAFQAFSDYVRLYPEGEQAVDARLLGTRALLAADRLDEAQAALTGIKGLRGGRDQVDNYGLVLTIVLQVADQLAARDDHARAITLLQQAPSRAQLLALQARRIAQLAQALAAANTPAAKNTLERRLANARSGLEQAEAAAALDLPIRLRLARSYLALDQGWHAILVSEDILTEFPAERDSAFALQLLAYAWRSVARDTDALTVAERFLAEFPAHELAAEMAALAGQLSSETGDLDQAKNLLGQALDREGLTTEARARILFQLGDTLFRAGNWPEAMRALDRFVAQHPQHDSAESAQYMAAVAAIFLPDHKEAETRLRAHLKRYPQTRFRADAEYRLAVCRFAFQEYSEVLDQCDIWLAKHLADEMEGELRSLRADTLKLLGREPEAIAEYIRASDAAASAEVRSYALGEAAALMEKGRDWVGMETLFSTRLERSPDDPEALRWSYWIARAKSRRGDLEGATRFVAERMVIGFGDPGARGVEALLTLYAQLATRRRAGAPETRVAPDAALRDALVQAGLDAAAPTIALRLGYLEAKLALSSRRPDEAQTILRRLGRNARPEDMPVALRPEIADALLVGASEEQALATELYESILTTGDASLRDTALNGLGQLALARGDHADALARFETALNETGAPNRLREVTLGRAQALFDLGRLDEAEPLFTQIAATREWRGEATAHSMHRLGEIAARRGDWPKAVVFYQRVFVSQGRHPEWVARSYLACGEALESLGKPTDAAATYRDMLRQPRLSEHPLLATASERIARLERAQSAPPPTAP